MNEPRNDYGFPLSASAALASMQKSLNLMDDINRAYDGRPSLKLERAQAIAAEVRARKFPPITKLEAPRHEMP